jgi:hypothetical protein
VRAAIETDPARRLEWIDLEPQPVRAYPNEGGARARPGLQADRLHQPRGRSVRHRAALGPAGWPPADLDSPARRVRPRHRRHRAPDGCRRAARTSPDHRRGSAAPARKELCAAWVADKAKMASAVVMDPATGEILAGPACPATTPMTTDGRPAGSLDPRRPCRQRGLRAGLGDEDVRRRGGVRFGRVDPQDDSSTIRRPWSSGPRR